LRKSQIIYISLEQETQQKDETNRYKAVGLTDSIRGDSSTFHLLPTTLDPVYRISED
jgi:hypothetical protein